MFLFQGQVEVMPLAAQLLQLAVLCVRCVAEGLLVQVEKQLTRPASAHAWSALLAWHRVRQRRSHNDKDLQHLCCGTR